jgi:hypothetical protein
MMTFSVLFFCTQHNNNLSVDELEVSREEENEREKYKIDVQKEQNVYSIKHSENPDDMQIAWISAHQIVRNGSKKKKMLLSHGLGK